MPIPNEINVGSAVVPRVDLTALEEDGTVFENNIPQIEKQNHYATGGSDGISNIQAIILGSRTKFLKAKSEAIEAEIANLVSNNYTKAEIDTLLQGLKPKASAKVATTANISLTGTQSIDGIAVAVGDRVLVKDQTTASQNGIYIVSASAWTRSLDTNTALEVTGAFVFVEQGTINADTAWVQTADNITLNTTNLLWVKFAGNGAFQAASTILSAIAALTSGVGYLNFNNGEVSISDAAPKFFIIEEQKPYNQAGGDLVVGINIRKPNTVTQNNIPGASLDATTGVFTLPAGTFKGEAWGLASTATANQLLLKNITDNIVYPGSQTASNTVTNSISLVSTPIFTLTKPTEFLLEHDSTTARSIYGLGGYSTTTSNTYANVFSQVKIEQLGA